MRHLLYLDGFSRNNSGAKGNIAGRGVAVSAETSICAATSNNNIMWKGRAHHARTYCWKKRDEGRAHHARTYTAGKSGMKPTNPMEPTTRNISGKGQ